MVNFYKKMNKVSINTNEISQKNAMELARSYNILYPLNKLKNILSSIDSDIDFSDYSKFQIHSLFNYLIQNTYSGEAKVKSLLVDYFLNEDAIAAFEINTFNGRLDFLRINGDSISYEIKSEVDNLAKLEKQISGYIKLFEYNYVVIAYNHLSKIREILPKEYGILIVNNEKIEVRRKAKKNKFVAPDHQIKLFTKKELIENFNIYDKDLILQSFTPKEINIKFKGMLKKRYFNRWKFLSENRDDILPLDYQYFYHHNISPSIIYA